MDVAPDALSLVLEVFGLEFDSCLVGIRYDEQIQSKGQQGDQGRGEYVRNHHPVETDSAGEDCYNLGIRCHLRREEDHGDEHEQRTEHVHEVWYEVDVVIEYDGLQRSFLRNEVVDSFADVEDDDDTDDQEQRHEERAYELSDYI